MFKQPRFLLPAVIALAVLFHVPLGLAEDEAITVDMAAYKCKDIMRMTDDERNIALAVLHGYRLGGKGALSYVPDELGKVSDDFIEYCLDNPAANAMESFKKLAK